MISKVHMHSLMLTPVSRLFVGKTLHFAGKVRIVRAHISTSQCDRMSSPIDLTASGDEETPCHKRPKLSHQADQEDGEKARQRIMAFAQQRNAPKALDTTVDLSQEHASHDLEPASVKPLTGRNAADIAKAAIMGQALQANEHGANALLAELAAGRRARQSDQCPDEGSASQAGASASAASKAGPVQSKLTEQAQNAFSTISILSYNIWFDDLHMEERMEAIGEIIMENGYPTVLCFQEVTPESFEMMRKSPWWGRYMSSPTLEQQSYDTAILYNKSQVTAAGPFQKQHFRNSIMGGSALTVMVTVGGTSLRFGTIHLQSAIRLPGRSVLTVMVKVGGTSLRFGTVHLESTVPGAPAAAARKEQLSQVSHDAVMGHGSDRVDYLGLQLLQDMRRMTFQASKVAALLALEGLDVQPEGNFILAGDMNWNDTKDGKPKLSQGWTDVWPELRAGDPGHTYDGPGNGMLSSSFRTRLDRIFVKLADWEAQNIEMVGREAIPGLIYSRMVRGKEKRLPVLPSDHYGLLLRLRRAHGAKEDVPKHWPPHLRALQGRIPRA